MTALRPGIAGSPDVVARDIDALSHTIDRFQAGLVPEAVFLETRLRHGIYGQRQDGVHMLRSKLPLGLIAPAQLEAFADLAEGYGHGVAHLTTRQDIQLHFVPLERTPDLMRVLADAEMTAREACGNVVRNITATPVSGIWPGEAFDVTPHGMALARAVLKHPDGQNLGRKIKITFSSTEDPRWDLSAIHDLAFIARIEDGVRGFRVLVGGGLGPVPHPAKPLAEFVPEEEVVPLTLAVLRVFGTHGEKRNRARARIKFLVAKWGIERFTEAVLAERETLVAEPSWTGFRDDLHTWDDQPAHPPGEAWPEPRDAAEAQWLRTNVFPQRQEGYAAVRVRVPRGDLSPAQLRGLATLLRAAVGDTTRIGADQSLLIRWVALDRLLALREGLAALDLGASRASGLGDTVTCPGADTCKLGITSPRAVAREIESTLDRLAEDPRLETLRIHVSGCPNSCSQHQIADIGLFGAARTVEGVTSPYYVLLLGGTTKGAFGTSVSKLPARRVGAAIERIASFYLEASEAEEGFTDFFRRTGRQPFRTLLQDLTELPSPAVAPELYREFGKEDAPFTMKRGVGECAGEVIELADLLLSDADREADRAVQRLEATDRAEAVRAARAALDLGARALLATEGLTNPLDFDTVAEFKARFYDTGRIFEGVGHYLLEAHGEEEVAGERLERLVVEAGLFVEEVHGMLARLRNPQAAGRVA